MEESPGNEVGNVRVFEENAKKSESLLYRYGTTVSLEIKPFIRYLHWDYDKGEQGWRSGDCTRLPLT